MLFEQTKNIIDVDQKGTGQLLRKIATLTSKQVSSSQSENKAETLEGSGYDGKRQYILSNIWRVYQILLEFTCRTDYQMITQ